MNETVIGLIGLATILALFLTGIELGFAMAVIGFLGFGYIVSFSAALNLLAKDIFDVFSSYGFTVIPLFVLMGQVAFNAGIAKRLYNTAYQVYWPCPRRNGHGHCRRSHGLQGHLRIFTCDGSHFCQRGCP